jgi:parvulin-like peptidyl-prolyl isomerase
MLVFNNVRYLTLGIIVLFLSGCANFYPQPSPTLTRPTIDVEPTSPATPAIQFIEATNTAISTLTEASSQAEGVNRPFENDLPLAARVNEQPIYLDTYQKQILQFESALTAQGIDLAGSQGQDRLAQIKQQVLDSLVDQALIGQEAARLGIIVSPEEVKLLAQDTIQNQAEFEAWLTTNQLTYEEFIANLQAQVTTNRLFERLTGDIPPQAEQVQLQYIRVDDLTTAQSIVNQLKSGASFEILAQEHSPDGAITTDEDKWYPKGANLLPDPVETTAFSLQPGQVQGPLQTSMGYYIIKVEDKAANRPISDRMLNLLKKAIFEKWLAEQRATAAIEIYVAF